jgi:hypothetical protein
MSRSHYGQLRTEHSQALDALNNHLEQTPEQSAALDAGDREPTRPEGHPSERQSPGWSSDQRMEAQQASANAWAKEANAQAADRQGAREALDNHIENGPADRSPEQTADIQRQPEPDIER